MKLINEQGIAVAEADSIRYDEEKMGWVAGDTVFTDPQKALMLSNDIKVSPVEFKLLFTAQERVAIKTARATDPVIDDFFSIIEDPRLTHVNLGLQSTGAALAYLESHELITAVRREQILAGQVQ